VAWIAAVVAALALILALVVVTVDIAKSHEVDPPALSIIPVPAGATVTASLRECPVTGHTCRLVAAVDQPTGDAVAIVTDAMARAGWPMVAGSGGTSTGCRSSRLCAKVWSFADYADTFGLPAGLTVPIDALNELRGHGALVVVTKTG
jgi:hypothetical protein